MPGTLNKVSEFATIDVALVVISQTVDNVTTMYGLTTGSKIAVEVQTETKDPVKLIVNGRLIAQKHQQVTVTGNKITLTDNVFTPEVVKVLQGGTVKYDLVDTTKVVGYTPPQVGDTTEILPFELQAYSVRYDEAGLVIGYEKISYPNCKGEPVALNSENDVFRAPEYTINSAPQSGQAPYDIDYVDALPEFITTTTNSTPAETPVGGG